MSEPYERGGALRNAIGALLEDLSPAINSEDTPTSSKAKKSEQLLRRVLEQEVPPWSPRLNTGLSRYGRGNVRVSVMERWAGSLIESGTRLDDEMDDMLSEAVRLGFGWSDRSGPIKSALAKTLEKRHQVRAFEIDVEHFLQAVARIEGFSYDVMPVVQMLNQLQHTYDRAYDVCALKLTTVSNANLSLASVGLAVVAALIALAGLLRPDASGPPVHIVEPTEQAGDPQQ